MKKRRKRTNKNVPAKGRLRDMADRLWSLAVRDDADHRCVVCNCRGVDAHHLIPRGNYATRYDLWNGIALCPNHHKFDIAISPHMNAAGWTEWLREHHPERHAWYLENLRAVFHDTKTVLYYFEVIRGLMEFVEPEVYEKILTQEVLRHVRETL